MSHTSHIPLLHSCYIGIICVRKSCIFTQRKPSAAHVTNVKYITEICALRLRLMIDYYLKPVDDQYAADLAQLRVGQEYYPTPTEPRVK